MKCRYAILIPCYNEAITIAKVVKDFREVLPGADIYVFDNNSTDNTARIAKESGAIVYQEPRQGKGNVIRSMFRQVDADIYILVDGDDTYPADQLPLLLEPILRNEADIVVGDRISNGSYRDENKRRMHTFGNTLVKTLINIFFSANLHDIMSGYRVMNRKFVKNMPVSSRGFEIETEMTLHALDKRFTLKEIPILYRDRPKGSVSKLNTFGDGTKVLRTIVTLFKDYRPLLFFGILSFFFFVLGLAVGLPVVLEFVKTAYVTKVPSAILSVGLMLISILSLFAGFILDTVVKQHRESYELGLVRWMENHYKDSMQCGK